MSRGNVQISYARLQLPLQEELGPNRLQDFEEEETKAHPPGGGIFEPDLEFYLLPLQPEEQMEASGQPSDIRAIENMW